MDCYERTLWGFFLCMTIRCGKISNSGGARCASHLCNVMISGCTINLSNIMASLNRCNNFFDDGNINAMFAGVFSTGSFNGLSFELGKSIGYRSITNDVPNIEDQPRDQPRVQPQQSA